MNRNHTIRWPLVSFLILGYASTTWAQCTACKWSDRGDRFEGIKGQPVSGGCCEVLGVHYRQAEKISTNATRLNLFFWLPEPLSPEIVVWQPSSNYMMMPKDKPYAKGLQKFSWPRQEVIAPLKLDLDTLYTKVRGLGDVYFPVLLTTSAKPKPTGSYVFFLESSGGIDAQCTIEREVDGRLTPIRSLRHVQEEFGGPVQIEWDGLDDRGKPAGAGVYVMRLKGQLEGESIENLNYTLHFQHYGRF